jgi:hypothetical protein
MKTNRKTMAAFLAAAAVTVGIAAIAQDNSYFQPTQPGPANNDFTNKVVMPTPEYYTNNQAAVSTDQQYRVQQEGVVGKGATALQHGPRIEPRPPTTIMRADPWVQQQHPWDFDPNNPVTPPAQK